MITEAYNKFSDWVKALVPSENDCISTAIASRDAPYYNHVIIANKRRDGYLITCEEFIDNKQVDTRFVFEYRGLNLSQTLDVLYALDKLNNCTEEQSPAYRMMHDTEFPYLPTRYADLSSLEEIEDHFCTKPNGPKLTPL